MIGVTMVYLVQHGEKQPLPGDPGLTELDRQQAARTGWWLRGLGVSAVWTSPMRRAGDGRLHRRGDRAGRAVRCPAAGAAELG